MMLGCGGKFSIIINNGELISVKTNYLVYFQPDICVVVGQSYSLPSIRA